MSENSSYFELQIKINPDIEDILSDICFENLPCEGVVLAEETYKDLEMIATTEGTLRVFLTGDGLEPDALKLQVETLLTEQRELLKSRGLSEEELGSWAFTFDEKANEDWSRKWKEKWDVTHVTDRITVVPDWLEYSPHREDEVIIRLEPGCAFGTGTHATTQLCMKAIEKYMPQHAEVADIGTGSGILAVCAKKFGADYVYGCDIDDTVIDVAKENAVKNLAKECPPPEEGSQNFAMENPPLEGGSKSMISGWGNFAQRGYEQKNIQLAKNLRNNATKSEQILWKYLRKSQLGGVKFRRQQPVGNYIVDFMASQEKIIIELDGGQHNSEKGIVSDKERDDFLLSRGFSVLRFWNSEINDNIDGVVSYILSVINDPTRKSKIFTLPQGEGSELGVDFELNTADKINRKFDFVMANILHNVLAEIMGDLKNLLKDDAYLSLSGILEEKKPVVLNAINHYGLKMVEELHQNQWVSFVVRK